MPIPQRAVIGSAGAARGKFLGFLDSGTDSSNATTYTFTTRALGAPHPKRYIIVAIGCDGSTPAVSTVTVGGQSASAVIQTIDSNSRAALWIARVPEGKTGSVVVTLTGAETGCVIGLFGAIMNSSTASATHSVIDTNNVTLTIPTYGFAVMAMADGTSGALSDSGGMTEHFDRASEGQEVWFGSRTTAGSYTSNITGDTSTNAKVIAAWSLA